MESVEEDRLAFQEALNELPYWIDRWFEAYQSIERILKSQPDYARQVIIVDYDELSAQPFETLSALTERLNIDLEIEQIRRMSNRFRAAPKRVQVEQINFETRERLSTLYQNLKSRSLNASIRKIHLT